MSAHGSHRVARHLTWPQASLWQVVHQWVVTRQLGKRGDLGLLVDLVHSPLVLLCPAPFLLLALLPLIPSVHEHAPVALCLHFPGLAPGEIVWAREDVGGQLSLGPLHLVAAAQVDELPPDPGLQGHDARPLGRVELPPEALAFGVLSSDIVVPHVAVVSCRWAWINFWSTWSQGVHDSHTHHPWRVARHQLLHPNTVVGVLQHKARVQPLVSHLCDKALKDSLRLLAAAQLILHLDEVSRLDLWHGKRPELAHALNLLHVQMVHDVPAALRCDGITYLIKWRPVLGRDRVVHREDPAGRVRGPRPLPQPAAGEPTARVCRRRQRSKGHMPVQRSKAAQHVAAPSAVVRLRVQQGPWGRYLHRPRCSARQRYRTPSPWLLHHDP
mmetsp:Transcript_78556/g.230449  ORF Transcript_78556/g.230449 Transcript_78556/m.230449 type:complete len:384 (-) Transcript_78556:33-1184(-)